MVSKILCAFNPSTQIHKIQAWRLLPKSMNSEEMKQKEQQGEGILFGVKWVTLELREGEQNANIYTIITNLIIISKYF